MPHTPDPATPSRGQILRVLALGLLAAVAWWPGLGLLLAHPEQPRLPGFAVALGLLGGLLCVLASARIISQDAEYPRTEAAWAGANVGGLSWLFGLAPVLAIWSQIPMLNPLHASTEPGWVLVTSMAESTARAAIFVLPSSVLALLFGAGLAALSVRSGPRAGLPTPHRVSTAGALLALVIGTAVLPVVPVVLGDLEATVQATSQRGLLLADISLLGWLTELQILGVGATGLISAALAVAGLRGRVLPAKIRPLVLSIPALCSLVILADHRLGAFSAMILAGALLGAVLPLQPAPPIPSRRILPLRVVPMAMALGLTAFWQLGLAMGFGLRRISELNKHGAAAQAQPELVAVLAKGAMAASVLVLALALAVLLINAPMVNWVIDLGRARQIYRQLRPPKVEETTMKQGISVKWVLIAVGLSLWIGGVASIGSFLEGGRRARAQANKQCTAEQELVDQLIVTREIQAGEQIRPGDVELRGIPVMMVPGESALDDAEAVVGSLARDRILPNELLRAERLAPAPQP